MIRVSLGLEGRKNVVFLNAIYVKEGCPPHQGLLQQLESVLHSIKNKFTRELFAIQGFYGFPKIPVGNFRAYIRLQSLSSEGLEESFFSGRLRRERDCKKSQLSSFRQTIVFMEHHLLIKVFV